jgi:hypothetical protein
MATSCRRTRALLSSQIFSIGTPRPLQLIIDDGRSPGSRVSAHPPLPGFWPVGCCECTLRLQLRGQPRFWPLLGRPHRVPFSAAPRSPGSSTIRMTSGTIPPTRQRQARSFDILVYICNVILLQIGRQVSARRPHSVPAPICNTPQPRAVRSVGQQRTSLSRRISSDAASNAPSRKQPKNKRGVDEAPHQQMAGHPSQPCPVFSSSRFCANSLMATSASSSVQPTLSARFAKAIKFDESLPVAASRTSPECNSARVRKDCSRASWQPISRSRYGPFCLGLFNTCILFPRFCSTFTALPSYAGYW